MFHSFKRSDLLLFGARWMRLSDERQRENCKNTTKEDYILQYQASILYSCYTHTLKMNVSVSTALWIPHYYSLVFFFCPLCCVCTITKNAFCSNRNIGWFEKKNKKKKNLFGSIENLYKSLYRPWCVRPPPPHIIRAVFMGTYGRTRVVALDACIIIISTGLYPKVIAKLRNHKNNNSNSFYWWWFSRLMRSLLYFPPNHISFFLPFVTVYLCRTMLSSIHFFLFFFRILIYGVFCETITTQQHI